MSNGINIHIPGNVLEVTLAVCSGAAAASYIASPLGSVGGALGATVGWFIGKPVQNFTTKLFNTDSPAATTVSRTAQFATNFFVNATVYMLTAAWMGVPLSFKASCVLAGSVIGMQIALLIVASVIASFCLRGSQV